MDRDGGIESELREFVARQKSASKTTNGQPSQNRQVVTGNGNVQVGVANAPVTIGGQDDFDPDNPNIAPCPACWKPVSRMARPCPKCGFDVAHHHESLELQRRREQKQSERVFLEKIMYWSMGLALGGFWLGAQSWMPDAFATLLWCGAGFAVVLAGILAKVLS
ncbi:MAG: hypothetical protein II007_04565 [Gammaproteobacteria bacterium]|nr:hypothetical protein [Gammaproteobacteria bacterium]